MSCQERVDWADGPQRWFLWNLPLGLAILGWVVGSWRWLVWSVALLWMGGACLLNAKRCGRVHCVFTGPLYVLLGLAALVRVAGWVGLSPGWLWFLAVGGTIVSHIPEWQGRRYSKKPQRTETEFCCEFHPPQKCGPTKCPQCQELGKTVKRITLGSLVKPERRPQIPLQDEFCFCRNPQCDVVYFRPGEIVFRKNDLSVKVGIKEPDNPTVPVCYCFGWTPQKIRVEIESTGKTTVIDQIKTQVKIGNCYCEVTNPQGACCLGNVSQVLKKFDSSFPRKS